MERSSVRLLVDIRPLCVGHVLVVPKAHAASLVEAPVKARKAALELAREAAGRLRDVHGEAGIYEHGGSPICQPRVCRSGPTHAHLHVAPLAEDIVGTWLEEAPLGESEQHHYLYQGIEGGGDGRRAPLGPNLPNHFVRYLLARALAERGRSWLPLGADPRSHLAAIEATRDMLGGDWNRCPETRPAGMAIRGRAEA